MTGRIERADGERSGAPFPPSWGPARGTPGSEERATWVASRVRMHVLDRRLITDPELREALLERKRFGPLG